MEFTQLSFKGRNAFVLVTRENDVSFWLNFDIQSSGNVLVESRQPTGLMSKYTREIFRDGSLDDRMYAGNNVLLLTGEELSLIQSIRLDLRNTNDWDAKYAPGASFTGHDIFPLDDLGDLR